MTDLYGFKLHIFDLDDTLINTRQAYGFAQSAALRDTFPSIEPQILERLQPKLTWFCQVFGSGNVREYMRAFLISQPGIYTDHSSVLDEIIKHYHHHFQSRLICFEGAKSYLDSLKVRKKKIALVSNGNVKSQLSKLKHTALTPYFPEQSIYISGGYAPDLKKPSPFMLEKACQDAGVKTRQAVYYGNSVTDIVAGNLAGVTTVHFSGTTPLPEDLPEIAIPGLSLKQWAEVIQD